MGLRNSGDEGELRLNDWIMLFVGGGGIFTGIIGLLTYRSNHKGSYVEWYDRVFKDNERLREENRRLEKELNETRSKMLQLRIIVNKLRIQVRELQKKIKEANNEKH